MDVEADDPVHEGLGEDEDGDVWREQVEVGLNGWQPGVGGQNAERAVVAADELVQDGLPLGVELAQGGIGGGVGEAPGKLALFDVGVVGCEGGEGGVGEGLDAVEARHAQE